MFLDDLERDDYVFDRDEVMNWLMENRGGYYSMTTQGLDFSYSDLEDELVNEGLISKEDEDEYAQGGGVNVYSSDEMFELNVFDGKTNNLLETKRFRARNQREAKSEAEDLEYFMHKKYGDYLHFKLGLAKPLMAQGGMTEHGLKVGDTIIEEFGDDSIGVRSSKGDFHSVNLDKGKRFANGGGVSAMLRNRRGK
jgi:hypothetical protein